MRENNIKYVILIVCMLMLTWINYTAISNSISSLHSEISTMQNKIEVLTESNNNLQIEVITLTEKVGELEKKLERLW